MGDGKTEDFSVNANKDIL